MCYVVLINILFKYPRGGVRDDEVSPVVLTTVYEEGGGGEGRAAAEGGSG
jgi:hypothetical protein